MFKKNSFKSSYRLKWPASLLCMITTTVMSMTNVGLAQDNDRPNILWLVSEDNSPYISAYGDGFAATPNIDRLADSGFTYTHAYANAPVCAPARNTIITGMYPPSNGTQHMRSNYPVTELIQFFPQLLKNSGYYVTNNSKEDYNIAEEQTNGIWNESSNEAHYNNREEDQPFFAVFNTNITHESSLFRVKPDEELRHDPAEVDLPPYHPDTPELRQQWAQYYDNIEDMDAWVGDKLRELEMSGEADNTIIFYYGDHGGVLPRSKRFVYETGTRVPLVISIPEKYKDLWPAGQPGSKVDRMVSFVDLAPTILSIAGVEVPDIMQGHAFLGDQATDPSEYVYMFRGRMDERYDMSRAARNRRFRYIRNYMPFRMYGQNVDFLFIATGAQSWRQTCAAGNCNEVQNRFFGTKPVEELYDTQNDPWEVHNLVDNPEYQDVLNEMRAETKGWMVEIKDTGVMPECLMRSVGQEQALYDYIRQENIDVEEWIDIANRAVSATEQDVPEFTRLLTSEDSVKRYWAAVALRILGESADSAAGELKTAVSEESAPFVHSMMAEALYSMAEKDIARQEFIELLEHDDSMVREFVLNAIDSVDDESQQIKDAVIEMSKRTNGLQWGNQDHRIVMHLLDKWNMNAEAVGLEIDMGWIGNFSP
ncbi:sulfatase-like hydrolase/transferase [Rhodohalobacter sp. 614A]|uniref:sulfatase-like hydrolase/transferase n=1 Tax=Rhodohalobacter sp. 614A TaxID=2908649 RepID=UPI001F26D933|nr:sulfatase-like hydrolase/transferase [Rhodohalobacter sp. 614A]